MDRIIGYALFYGSCLMAIASTLHYIYKGVE